MIGTSKQLSKVSVSSIRAGDVDIIRILGEKSGLLVRLAHGYGNAYNKDLWKCILLSV